MCLCILCSRWQDLTLWFSIYEKCNANAVKRFIPKILSHCVSDDFVILRFGSIYHNSCKFGHMEIHLKVLRKKNVEFTELKIMKKTNIYHFNINVFLKGLKFSSRRRDSISSPTIWKWLTVLNILSYILLICVFSVFKID